MWSHLSRIVPISLHHVWRWTSWASHWTHASWWRTLKTLTRARRTRWTMESSMSSRWTTLHAKWWTRTHWTTSTKRSHWPSHAHRSSWTPHSWWTSWSTIMLLLVGHRWTEVPIISEILIVCIGASIGRALDEKRIVVFRAYRKLKQTLVLDFHNSKQGNKQIQFIYHYPL